jgi:CBS domain-containing protein
MQICEIMRHNPVSITELETVGAAARRMSESNVGLLPVVASASAGKVVGIVTDRDLVVRVMAHERSTSTLVRDCMTKAPVCVGLLDDVRYAMLLMSHKQVRALPVVDLGNNLIGVITVSDLLAHYVNGEDLDGMLRCISRMHMPLAA